MEVFKAESFGWYEASTPYTLGNLLKPLFKIGTRLVPHQVPTELVLVQSLVLPQGTRAKVGIALMSYHPRMVLVTIIDTSVNIKCKPICRANTFL